MDTTFNATTNCAVRGLHNFTFNETAFSVKNFFEVYYSVPRFVIETVMAVAAIVANLFTMVLLLRGSTKQNGAAYRILFYNLSVTNSLCCVLSWLANNSLLLFRHQFVRMIQEPDEGFCRVFICLMAVMFVSVAFGIESSITMMGFTAVQYRSVSMPLVHWAITRQRMACIFLAVSWITTFVFGCVPFCVLLWMAKFTTCSEEIHSRALSIVTTGATTAIAVECVSYVIVIVLSGLIYVKLRRYSQGFWNVRFDNQIRSQKRTFGTTLMLFVTLVIFSLPYMALYVITLHSNNISHVQESAVIHYMTMLPYLKFLSDPLIYGMRMREVKESWFKILVKCGLDRCACARDEFNVPHSPPPYLMHHITFL